MKRWRWRFLALALSVTCAPEQGGRGGGEIIGEALTAGQINGNSLPQKTVVFTYDDGPDEHTLALARYLADNDIRATFFVNGRRFCKVTGANGSCAVPPETRACNGREQAPVTSPRYYPEALLDELLALGHRVGNHTQDHCYLPQQSDAMDLVWEVKATQEIIDRHVCDGQFLFRAPYGNWNGTTAARLNAATGISKLVGPINWDVDGEDWECWQKGVAPENCADRYFRILTGRARQNGIFLMHDRPEFNVGHEGPLLMTKLLVPKLKAAGFRFGTIDEVLNLGPRDGGAGCSPDAGTRGASDSASERDATATPPVDTALAETTKAPVDAAKETGGTGGAPDATVGGPDGAAGADSGTGPDAEQGAPPGGGGRPHPGRGGCQCGVGASSRAAAGGPLVLTLLLVALTTWWRDRRRRLASP